MSYDAKGSAYLYLRKNIDKDALKKRIVEEAYSCGIAIADYNENRGTLYLVYDNNYDEDSLVDFLAHIALFLPKEEQQTMEFEGEDGELWRFLFSNGHLYEQRGYIEWGDDRELA